MANLRLQADLARQTLQILYDSFLSQPLHPELIEVRGKKLGDKALNFRGFYPSPDSLVQSMEGWNPNFDYWFGVALRASGKDGSKGNLVALPALFTDIDYGQEGHKKPSKWQTRQEALDTLTRFPLRPSVVVHTGGGFQAYWRLKEPVDLRNAEIDELENIMKALAQELGGDTGTHDVSRILRLPGTFNMKLADNPRLVTLEWADPGLVYDLSQFVELASPTNGGESREKELSGDPADLGKLNLGKLNLKGWVRTLILTGVSDGYPSRSERDNAVIRELWEAGHDLETIEAIFRDYPVGDKFRGKGAHGRAYLKHSLRDLADYPAIIEHLNQKHAVVNLNGKCVILNEQPDPFTDEPDITFSGIEDFGNFYRTSKILNPSSGSRGQKKEISIAKFWLGHSKRREYDGVVFSPGKDVPKYYNLYRGLGVTPKPGDWSLLQNHILENIVEENIEHYNWIITWMADLFQNPGGDKPGTAIVLRGAQGVGKGFFVKWLGRAWGRHYLQITNQTQIIGRFNAHLKDSLLVFCDEAIWGGDRKAEGVLKGLITEQQIVIEPKGVNAFTVRNHMRFILASNSAWVVPAGWDDRRFCVLDVSEAHKQDHEYFSRINHQMKNGGLEGMVYDLLTMDISGVNLRKPPRTSALQEQITMTMGTASKFWYEYLKEDTANFFGSSISVDSLYAEYVDFAKTLGGGYRVSKEQFGKEIKKMCPSHKKERRTMTGGNRQRFYVVPDLSTCRKEFEKAIGCPVDDWDQ